MPTELKGWRFPDTVEPKEEWFFRMKFSGRGEVYDLDVDGCVDLVHMADVNFDGLDVEIVDSGVDDDGIRYAAAKATVTIDGKAYSWIGSADATSQQVKNPEFLWSVATSRAFKRAVKMAFGLVKSSGEMPDADQTGDIEIDEDHPRRSDAMTKPVEPEQPPEPKERTKKAIETDEDLSW